MHLLPVRLRPDSNNLNKERYGGQFPTSKIWDPVLGTYRAQRVPKALSRSKHSDHTRGTYAEDGLDSCSVSSRSSRSSTLGTSLSAQSGASSIKIQRGSGVIAAPHIFQQAPANVLHCIIQKLKSAHESPAAGVCQTCYTRDLCALARTSRAWDKAVITHLYGVIHIVGQESPEQAKRYKTKSGLRLKLLRRTLRGRAFLAQHVRELKVPNLGHTWEAAQRDLAASLVMACPNLERLVGFYPYYGHQYDRLTHAMSTRKHLTEHVWMIKENEAITQRSQMQLAPGLMDPIQKATFVHHHAMWSSLTTLFLHSTNQGILEKDVFLNEKSQWNDLRKVRGPGILHRLPCLRHLCISNFDMDDFDDYTLQHLPPLHSLRLQNLEGVTFWGLSEFSKTRNAFDIRKLALIDLDILYISALSNILSRLKNLRRFTFVQDTSPEVPAGEAVVQPIMAALQLEYLHWDVAVPGSAYENLVSSLQNNGFPHLQTIRMPHDHYGAVQALCKPRAQIVFPSDWSAKAILEGDPDNGLRAARRAAQERLEDAWSTTQFKVVVEAEGAVHEIHNLNGYMGTIGSKLNYNLLPDLPGSDLAPVDFDDIDIADDLMKDDRSQTCRGAWNKGHPLGSGWWSHAERPRWRPINLMDFF